jgi:hypothetical protein
VAAGANKHDQTIVAAIVIEGGNCRKSPASLKARLSYFFLALPSQ